MQPVTYAVAMSQLAPYGYSLTPENVIVSPRGTASGVVVNLTSGRRFQCRTASRGSLLWSGPDLGAFLEKFWFVTKLPS